MIPDVPSHDPETGARPHPSACFLWEDAETGERLRVSVRLAGDDAAAFFADLEATGFRRLDGNGDSDRDGAPDAPKEPTKTRARSARVSAVPGSNARRSGQVEPKDGEDGGTLPCSIDVISAFHAADGEHPLPARPATGEDLETVRRESA